MTTTEFKIGDIVRLTKGEPDTPGYGAWVLVVTSGDLSSGTISLCALRAFEDAGGEIELVERPLPTRPNTLGWATVNGTRRLVRLGVCGQWEVYGKNGALAVKPRPSVVEDFEEAVLIPKGLADKVMEWADDDHRRGWHSDGIMQQIADHLKGQDDE